MLDDMTGQVFALTKQKVSGAGDKYGRVLRLSGDRKRRLAEGLQLPAGRADAHDGSVYVAESASGRLLRISLADRHVTVVAESFGTVRAIATTPAAPC